MVLMYSVKEIFNPLFLILKIRYHTQLQHPISLNPISLTMHILFLSVLSENTGKCTPVFINYNQVNFTGSNNFTRNIGSVIEVSERVCKANPSRWVGLH